MKSSKTEQPDDLYTKISHIEDRLISIEKELIRINVKQECKNKVNDWFLNNWVQIIIIIGIVVDGYLFLKK